MLASCKSLDVCSAEEGCIELYWPGTDKYQAVLTEFRISIDQARKFLLEKTKGHKMEFFDSMPTFLTSTDFFFGEPNKYEISISGFYVNGMSGRIIYKESNRLIEAREFQIRATDFYLEETID
jgi:hypothetical protein